MPSAALSGTMTLIAVAQGAILRKAQSQRVAIFRETRRDIPISLGSEKSATSMPSAARDVLRPLRLALRAAPQLPQ